MIAQQLSRVRQKPLLTKNVREFLADFGPTIAIFTMTAAAWAMHPIELEHLAVPHEFTTTSGRPWLVDPMDVPAWFPLAAIPIAGLAAVLLFLGSEHHRPPRQQSSAPAQEGRRLQPRHGGDCRPRCDLRDHRPALGRCRDGSIAESHSKLGDRPPSRPRRAHHFGHGEPAHAARRSPLDRVVFTRPRACFARFRCPSCSACFCSWVSHRSEAINSSTASSSGSPTRPCIRPHTTFAASPGPCFTASPWSSSLAWPCSGS